MRAVAVAAIGVLLAAGAASGRDSASRIVDRTLVCRATGEGFPDPIRVLGLAGYPRSGLSAPSVNVWNGTGEQAIAAGFRTDRDAGRPSGGVWFSRTRCTATSRRVALSTTGLRGGTPRFGASYKCDIPGQVLLRIRAVFARAVTLAPDPRSPSLLHAKGRISTGQLAVTTAQGRPIAFAAADNATGKVRLFTAQSRCYED